LKLYVDTSVLVAALGNESRTVDMQDWMAEQLAEQLVISDWVVTEFSAALSRKVRMKQLEPAQREDVLAVFSGMIQASFEVAGVSRIDFRAAARMADLHTTGLRAGDALHLAVAASNSATIYSLDRGLVEAAESMEVAATLL